MDTLYIFNCLFHYTLNVTFVVLLKQILHRLSYYLFFYAYIKFQCKMDFSNKRKRSTYWTHTKKGILHCTVSQSAIPCQQPQNAVENNTSSYPLSQGSDPKFLQIKCNVIPHKSTNRSCQTLNELSHQSCQVSLRTILQSVQVAISKKHIGTQCYCADFTTHKGMSKCVRDEQFWENFINFLCHGLKIRVFYFFIFLKHCK